MAEPAIVLFVVGLLVFASIAASRVSDRLGVRALGEAAAESGRAGPIASKNA